MIFQKTLQIINPPNTCLTAVVSTKTLTTKPCSAVDLNQKWHWGYENITALENWDTFGVKIPKTL